MSPTVDLDIPDTAETSKIFAADGSLITTLHAEEDREKVPLASIPEALRDAVVAIEDERFWEHKGVDVQAVVRAARENAGAGKVVEGGSTITQQYVKLTFVGRDRDLRRKLKEASLAYQLERRYTKEKILELYLNSVYFGNGAYGVETAAREYFGLGAEKLGLAQSALLAGLIRSPNALDPYDHPEAALRRRATVLAKMAELHLAGPQAIAAAHAEPLGVTLKPAADRYPAPHFVEQVKRLVLDDPRFGTTPQARRDALFRGGLRIHTTLDLQHQAEAEKAVSLVLSRPGRDPAAALVSLEPATGYVRALVGGADFFGGGSEAKFDLATQGRRPAGSAFKPFVLAAALKKGIPLGRSYAAPPRISIRLPRGEVWNVDNYEGSGGGRMDLVEATVHSSNTVYSQLIMDVGPEDAVATARDMGIRSPLQPLPSAVLGTNDVTPLDMASAYGTLANRGLATPPVFVNRITDRSGREVYVNQRGQKRVLASGLVADEVDVLQQVVERGTGVHAKIGRPVAGKTGTGQAWRDAWFVGFTPDLVTSVWVGFPREQRSMVPPTTRIRVTGGRWPAEIWQLYTSAALAQVPVSPFPLPPPPPQVETPDVIVPDVGPRQILENVVGMPAEEGEAVFTRQGFTVITRVVPNAEYPPGYVVGQKPRAGAQVRAGSTVTLQISKAAIFTTVPDVLGRSEEEARGAMASVGLQVRVTAQEEPHAEGRTPVPGQVWKQTPLGGSQVDESTVVRMWVNPH
ncbi:MAG TPA: transglycosylase domain-containing protein [Acidimicrobiales bacterium]|nr:transglycosylase domain-containing protein [Acidimicrobiales bacterium]